MNTNPYRTPHQPDDPPIRYPEYEHLGRLLFEHRVSGMIALAAAPLLLFSIGMMVMGVYEWSTNPRFPSPSFWLIVMFFAVAVISATLIAGSMRTKFLIFERGLVFRRLLRERGYRYADIARLFVSRNPLRNFGRSLNPMKPHLVVCIDAPHPSRHFIRPFLLANLHAFEIAIRSWAAES
jgi:hypothetical protein